MRAHKRRNVTGVRRRLPAFVLMLVVAALCIAGVIYKGAEVTQVNVNDGGIWVTNKSKQLVGHLDYEARILDGALRTEATNFDVGQAGETVTVSDLGSLTVAPVNVTQVALGSPTARARCRGVTSSASSTLPMAPCGQRLRRLRAPPISSTLQLWPRTWGPVHS